MKEDRCRVSAEGDVFRLIDRNGSSIKEANEFLDALEVRSLSPRTIRAYAYDMLSLYRWLDGYGKPLAALSHTDLLSFVLAQKQQGAHPHSINRRLVVIGLLYRFHTNREMDTAAGTSLPGRYYKGAGRDRRLGAFSMSTPQRRALRTTVQNKFLQSAKPPVIPANAGIHLRRNLDSRMRGNDSFF